MPTVSDLNALVELSERLDRFSFSGKRNGAAAMVRWLGKAGKRRGLDDFTRAILWNAWLLFFRKPTDGGKVLNLKKILGGLVREYRAGALMSGAMRTVYKEGPSGNRLP